LLPFVSQTLLYNKMLYSNPYSNADEHQRKYRTRNEQNMHISSTKRTQANTSEQHKSSPPFGTQARLKPGYKLLQAVLISL